MPMGRTAARPEAARCVAVYERGTSWTITGPYADDNLDGPYTASSAPSYWAARLHAARWKASIVLALMGRHNARTIAAVYHAPGPHNVRALVDYALGDAP